MTFYRTEPNSQYRALRLLSESGHWELGMSPYSHGMRMRMGLAGRPPQVIDFCMGRDGALFPEILTAILRRLDPLQERVTAAQVDSVFPWHGTRPDMNLHLGALLGKEPHDQLSNQLSVPIPRGPLRDFLAKE